MKRKPILGTSLKRRRNEKGKIIAIAGVVRGVGVTHTTIMLANYLSRERYKVAVVELNPHGHFGKIEKAYEGIHFDSSLTSKFKIKGVVYYKSVTKEQLIRLYQEEYNYIILDIGSDVEAYSEEYRRADLPFIIARTSEWKLDEIEAFRYSQGVLMTNRCQWILPFAKPNEVKELSKKIEMSCMAIGFIGDPFIKSKEIDQQLAKIIKP